MRELVTSAPWGAHPHVDVLSGADGRSLVRYDTDYDSGRAIAVIGDVDHDGVSDLLVGGADRVDVVSTATASRLYFVTSPPPFQFGRRVAAIGDADRDGVEDFAASTTYWTAVFSGADGTQLFEFIGPSEIASRIDFDDDGWDDLLLGILTDPTGGKDAGRVDVVSLSTHPRIHSIVPPRAHYRGGDLVTVNGRYFTVGSTPLVEFDGAAASDVTVLDDATLTCTVPAGETGPADVRASNELGANTLSEGLRFTPSAQIEGDFRPGGSVLVRWWIDPGDAILGVWGVPPPVAESTPPSDGTLAIDPFLVLCVSVVADRRVPLLFVHPRRPVAFRRRRAFQALAGPALYGTPKDGAWTNTAALVIE